MEEENTLDNYLSTEESFSDYYSMDEEETMEVSIGIYTLVHIHTHSHIHMYTHTPN